MEEIALENHIVKQFDEELDEIRALLMAMGGMVAQQLQDSIQSIVKVDSGLADSVIERDKRVDEMELEIDEACLTIIARRQPAATDLRLVMMVSKAVNDLERIGDEAKKIAKQAILLSEQEKPWGFTEVRHLGKVRDHRVTANVFAQGQWQAHGAVAEITRGEDFAQHNFLAVLVR